jgi:hypothetical protein
LLTERAKVDRDEAIEWYLGPGILLYISSNTDFSEGKTKIE